MQVFEVAEDGKSVVESLLGFELEYIDCAELFVVRSGS
jgi:hypothetical protein